MALYLGSEKLGVTIPVPVGGSDGSSGVHCATGVVTVDDDDIIRFPELDFDPTLIAVWNVTERDLKEEAEDEGEEWNEDYVQYVQEGLMAFAIYDSNIEEWIVQVLKGGSGQAYIANESFQMAGDNIPVYMEANGYCYNLDPFGDEGIAGMEFNYAIYG